MPQGLADAVVAIAGTSGGIERATALAIATKAAALALLARDDEALRRVAGECRARGATVLAERVDVTDEPAVAEFAAGRRRSSTSRSVRGGHGRRARRGFELVNGVAQKLWSRLAPHVMERLALSSGASPVSSGNLFEPLHDQGSAPR
jgi:NAD(P)-dependent dehydrogenase (short-subunit alcohol dehydrogenase family)